MAAVRIVSLILTCINAAAWGGLALFGFGLVHGVSDQHAIGYPNWEQIAYYLIFPTLMLCVSLSRPIWKFRSGKQNLGTGTSLAMLAVLPLYLAGYTGGV